LAEGTQQSPNRILCFGVFQFNVPARELRKHGVRIRLRGQPYSLLAMLLEQPGDVVTRGEMREKLWASDTFVDFEHSLNSAIKKLRTALGDTPENSRYIETLPRIGYRFIAPVSELEVPRPEIAQVAAKSKPTTAKNLEDCSRRRHWHPGDPRQWILVLPSHPGVD